VEARPITRQLYLLVGIRVESFGGKYMYRKSEDETWKIANMLSVNSEVDHMPRLERE